MAGNVIRHLAGYLDSVEDRMLLSFSQKDGDVVTITTTFYNGEDIKYKPFSVRGALDELAQETGYWAELEKFKNVIEPKFSSLDDLEKEVQEAEKVYQEKLKMANKVPEVKKGRCVGAFDQELCNQILTVPITDESYPKILGKANLQTLLEVLTLIAQIQEKKRFNLVSKELKKITGAGAEEQGIMYEQPVENKQGSLF